VNGPCDVPEAAGGAGGAGSGGAANGGAPGAGGDVAAGGNATGGTGGEGGAGGPVQDRDCEAPLQCVNGTCLTPDGESCVDNVDCVNTCVDNICAPKGNLDGSCDDSADCLVEQLVCDEDSNTCKLDLSVTCTDNAQCESNRCICADSACSVRACKNPDAVCQCKWSGPEDPTCSNGSANLDPQVQDPNGCNESTGDYCNNGQCVDAIGGTCAPNCVYHAFQENDPNTDADDVAAYCTSTTATGCAGGYHENVTADCAPIKFSETCSSTCQCDLD
jgi:hypothetical protein